MVKQIEIINNEIKVTHSETFSGTLSLIKAAVLSTFEARWLVVGSCRHYGKESALERGRRRRRERGRGEKEGEGKYSILYYYAKTKGGQIRRTRLNPPCSSVATSMWSCSSCHGVTKARMHVNSLPLTSRIDLEFIKKLWLVYFL